MNTKSRIFRRCILAASILTVSAAPSLHAQSPVFTPGNLVLSRSVYNAPANAVPFPGSLPNNAASVSDASFPAVFNNETPDGSFGITTGIYLDQLDPTIGAPIGNPLDVTGLISSQLGLNITTSFPSKSELGLNFTPDGTGVTFMAYGAAASQLDVSNSNTPGHVDITNPVNGRGILITQRDIVELSYDGVVQVTATNGYSGNNGRNVVLGANGNYYTVGNAGNNGSSKTLAAGTVAFSGTSITLSGASTTTNLYVGTPFSGTGIPTGTHITAIADQTHFTISAAATGSPAGSYVANSGAVQLVGVSFGIGNPNITVTGGTALLVPGMPLTGSGFAAGSYISSITDATHFVASANPTANSGTGSYTAAVSNSMLSDNTGARMIAKGANDTMGTGTGILDAVNASMVVGKVNGTYGTTPGYERGFTVSQLGVVLNGTTASGSPTITGLSPSVSATLANNVQLYAGLPVTGPGLPTNAKIASINSGANTVTLTVNATASATVNLTFAPAVDKSGKDDNFRGITNYNNTLYCAKGSGGNGFDAVFQVNPSGGGYVAPGTSAGLPTAANAGSASVNPLPGWPTGSTGANEGATNGTTVHHPFGMWFANDTTLYVADEGLAGSANAAPGGLEKWIYNPGTGNWEYKYTVLASTIPNYSASGTVGSVSGSVGPLQANGLRNIAGKNNGDGTVTIYGITSTAAGTGGATLNDEGADPNQLVSVTDTIANTANPGSSFTVLRTAAYGEVLRGVAFAPGRVSVALGGFTLNRRTNRLSQSVTLTNDSNVPVTGPVQLVLGGLTGTLLNGTGTTANNYPVGAAYITAAAGNLAPGASVNVVLQFPAGSGSPTYTPTTVTGTTAP